MTHLLRKMGLIALCALMGGICRAQSPLIGTVTYAPAWTDVTQGCGLYDIFLSPAKATLRSLQPELLSAKVSGVRVDNLYYATNYYISGSELFVYHSIYDLADDVCIYEDRAGTIASAAVDMTYDAQEGVVYGCFLCPEDLSLYVFGKIDLNTWEVSRIAILENPWALAAAPDGTLFAVNPEGTLLKVNKADGTTTQVGATGADIYFESSAVCSADGGTLYLTVSPLEDACHILSVSTETGRQVRRTTLIGQEQVLGLELNEPTPAAGAPARPVAMSAQWTAGGTAHVAFILPATLYGGGQPDDATCTARISLDGTEVWQGACAYGQAATADIAVAGTGYHVLTLRLSNAAGESQTRSVRYWMGYDVPQAPQNVTFQRDDTKNTLTWSAPTASEHGGVLETATLTYDVYRYPAGDCVATGLTSCRFEETFDEPASPTLSYYGIRAVCGNGTSAEATSNRISVGAIHPPYSQDFSDEGSLETFTVCDRNQDGETWKWYYQQLRVFGSDEASMDDWLILPAAELTGGKYYEFSVQLHGFKRAYAEHFRLGVLPATELANLEAGREDAFEELLPLTLLCDDNYHTWTVGFLCPSDGNYYFAIHGASPAGTQYIYADNVSISAPLEPTLPCAPSDLVATRAAGGAKSVEVAFTLPEQTVGGDALDAIASVSLVRDGYAEIFTWQKAEPGQRLTYTDASTSTGFHRYSVTCTARGGQSVPAECVQYVGPYAPMQPTDFQVVRTATDGEVKMTWTAPALDAEGEALDPQYITYTVAGMKNDELAYLVENLAETEFTYQALPAGSAQQFCSYALYAVTDGGSSLSLQSQSVPVGTAYEMPFVESFSGGEMSYVWSADDVAGVSTWSVFTDDADPSLTSVDADGGFIACQSLSASNISALTSGAIEVSGSRPVLEFAYWSFGPDDLAETHLYVKDVTPDGASDGTWQPFSFIEHCSAAEGWQSASLSMAKFTGRTVQMQIQVITGSDRLACFDNIRLRQDVEANMSVTSATIPERVQGGEPFSVVVRVQNNGISEVAADDYDVILLIDGAEVSRHASLKTLRAGRSTDYTFTHTFSVLEEGTHTVEVGVWAAADDLPDDNTTGPVDVTCYLPDYPAPSGLTATASGTAQTALTWQQPTEPTPYPRTEDSFETYEPWSTSGIGAWTLVDNDHLPSGDIANREMPGVGGTLFAYIVYDDTYGNLGSWWTAHTGHQNLMCIYPKGSGNSVDEWLISPPLSRHAHDVQFWTRSVAASFPEAFQVLASSTGTDLSDFSLLLDVPSAPYQWTQWSVSLPEGTRHFAIRCYSNDAYMFFLDDVSFEDDTYTTADLLGYRIYRNGTLLTPSPVTECRFDDATALTDDAVYHVTAVYEKGESRPVRWAATGTDAIATPTLTDATQSHPHYDLSGRRVTPTHRGLTISRNGKKVVR